MSRIIGQQVFALASLCAVAWGAGCAGHRVPAIDPTGRRIFSGATTTIVSPLAECPLLHPSPRAAQPAAVLPTVPSPCQPAPVVAVPPPVAAAPAPVCATPPPAAAGVTPLAPSAVRPPACPSVPAGPQIRVTPGHIVAPVCTEVIVAAGLCDPKGYYLTGQPLEWMLSPDSVGHIVQVGHETRTSLVSHFRGSPHKVGTNYVRAFTSRIAQTIDRGTPNPLDDVSLARGQSWISVSSPSEGTTHVTVWAPGEKDWQRRRATARIHWIDAKWSFPAPQAVRLGQAARLTTRVMRSGGAPVAGWLVRYDVLDGPEASFVPSGGRSAEVATLANGTASIDVASSSTTPGITQVRVQIVRPASQRGDLPDMIVGQGLTSVTWSAPGLQVSASGPDSAQVGGTLSYRVEVVNAGDLVARDVKLSFTPPRTLTFLSSSPTASPFGQTFQWRLGNLAPRSVTVVQVNCRAEMAADVRACFRAESAERLTSEHCVSTRVAASALTIRMTGPQTAEVGQTVEFRIELVNTGRTPLTNVVVRDTFDPGLVHADGQSSPIERTIPEIAPGASSRIAVRFQVAEPGQQCHRVDARADGGHAAAARGCVTGVPARAALPAARAGLSLNVKAPARIEVGRRGVVEVEVANASTSDLAQVQLAVEFPDSLEATQASPNLTRQENQALAWTIALLPAGQRTTRRIELEGKRADARASIRASASSEQTPEQTKEAPVPVVTPAAAPPLGSKTPGKAPAAAAGQLRVTIADNPDPVTLGREVAYRIDIANQATVADSDVIVTLSLPDGFTFRKMEESTGRLTPQPITGGRNQYELTPIAGLRPGETFVPVTIRALAGREGKHTFRVHVKSARYPAGIEATAETTVVK
jgi:uncharacterized repeat protein (TIGR01451 family)